MGLNGATNSTLILASALAFMKQFLVKTTCVFREFFYISTIVAYAPLRVKETVDDFHQRSEFYCQANKIMDKDEARQTRKKALFITMIGQTMFVLMALPH